MAENICWINFFLEGARRKSLRNNISREMIANSDDNGNEIGDDNLEIMKVLELLEENASVTAKQMAGQMNISTRKVSRLIKTLKESGKIIRVGSDRKGYWKIIQ